MDFASLIGARDNFEDSEEDVSPFAAPGVVKPPQPQPEPTKPTPPPTTFFKPLNIIPPEPSGQEEEEEEEEEEYLSGVTQKPCTTTTAAVLTPNKAVLKPLNIVVPPTTLPTPQPLTTNTTNSNNSFFTPSYGLPTQPQVMNTNKLVLGSVKPPPPPFPTTTTSNLAPPPLFGYGGGETITTQQPQITIPTQQQFRPTQIAPPTQPVFGVSTPVTARRVVPPPTVTPPKALFTDFNSIQPPKPTTITNIPQQPIKPPTTTQQPPNTLNNMFQPPINVNNTFQPSNNVNNMFQPPNNVFQPSSRSDIVPTPSFYVPVPTTEINKGLDTSVLPPINTTLTPPQTNSYNSVPTPSNVLITQYTHQYTHQYNDIPTNKLIIEEDIFNQSNIRPRPVMAWGHGGRLYTMFPAKIPRLNVLESTKNDPYALPGLIKEHKVIKILQQYDIDNNSSINEWLTDLMNYPIPVFNNNNLNDTKYVDRLMEYIDKKMQKTFELKFNSSEPSQHNTYILWALLKIFLQRKTAEMNPNNNMSSEEMEKYNEQQLSETVLKVLVLLGSDNLKPFFNDKISTDAVVNSNPKEIEISLIDEKNELLVIKEIEKSLLLGDIATACETAVNNKLWSHGLILASMMKKKKFEEVICAFTQSMGSTPSSLPTLYYTFASRPQYITDSTPNTSSVTDVAQDLAKKQEREDTLTNNWWNHLSILLANIVNETTQAGIYNIGSVLLRKRLWTYSQFCYSVGEFLFSGTGPKQTGFVLLGERGRGRGGERRIESIQLTDIYEYIKQRMSGGQRHCSVEYQGYRLGYGYLLLDLGIIDNAQEISDSITNVLRHTKDYVKFNKYFMYHYNYFRFWLGLAKPNIQNNNPNNINQTSNSNSNSSGGGGVTGWFAKALDSGISRIIHGNNETPQPQPQSQIQSMQGVGVSKRDVILDHQQPTQSLIQSGQMQQGNVSYGSSTPSSISFDNTNLTSSLINNNNTISTTTSNGGPMVMSPHNVDHTTQPESKPFTEKKVESVQSQPSDSKGPSGWLGWIFGKQSMNIGKKNAFKWSEQYQLWYKEGEEDPKAKYEASKAPPPPDLSTTTTTTTNATIGLSEPLTQSPTPSPSPPMEPLSVLTPSLASRYVDSGFGVAPLPLANDSDKGSLLTAATQNTNELLNFGLSNDLSSTFTAPLASEGDNNPNNNGLFFIPSPSDPNNEGTDNNNNETGFSFSSNISFNAVSPSHDDDNKKEN